MPRKGIRSARAHERQLQSVSTLPLYGLLCSLVALNLTGCRNDREGPPRSNDDRLEMTLVASDPDIVTPIGLAVDEEDRLYVVESHTHQEPSDYEGPDGDYVKILADEDGDGDMEVIGVFAEGFEDGMNLAFSPDGVLHLVTSRSVWALYDRDEDGMSEDRERLLHMDRPDYVYDHAGLMGIAFAPDGWMYVSRGNVGGQAWRLTGTDGSTLDGYGDGGNIVRARTDGSELQEVATGFWNPFHIFVDSDGRLIATDNDPDSRGPNRLLHIIQGGHYGYESLYGGSGIHPFLAWNGDLPGTLPYAAGLGEAPTGCIESDIAASVEAGASTLLCAIWEESSIDRVRLMPHGASVQGKVDRLIEGDSLFRPVAMAANDDGAIYVTDWVIRRYPNHGRGRIWRIGGVGEETAESTIAPVEASSPASIALGKLYKAERSEDFSELRAALTSKDPFVRTSAVTALTRPIFRNQVLTATEDSVADVRLGALLALQRSGHENAEPVARRLLSDADPRVRQMALIWIGKAGMASLRADVERVADEGMISPALFETYLATLRHLDPEFIQAFRNRAEISSQELKRKLPDGFIESFAADTTRNDELRAASLSYLQNPAEMFDLLEEIARGEILPLRVNAVRVLARTSHAGRTPLLLDLAEDTSNPADLRAEAVLSLPQDVPPNRVAAFLADAEAPVRLEAARHLRGADLDEGLIAEIGSLYTAVRDERGQARLTEQLEFILGMATAGSPESTSDWWGAISEGGDPAIGRRVFFWPRAQCAQCHMIDNFGGDVGPDLTNAGASKTREQLFRAIIDPSAEVAPDWQGWYVRTSNDEVHYGRQINVGDDDVELYTLASRFVRFDDAVDWGVAEKSLMPAGLENRLTVHDFRDLLAFLEQRQ